MNYFFAVSVLVGVYSTFQEVAGVSVEIGSYLRQARESIGLSLDQLQDKTKIQKSFLIAIENGEFHKLPSPFYVRTYLRSYANCVKVEPHHILRQYRKEEQAERGLTGVHKAVNEKDLAQATQKFPPLTAGRMPNSTGPQKSASQSTGPRSQSLSNTSRNMRTSANTALTIAKSEEGQAQDLSRRDKELARRDLGYQRTSGAMRQTRPMQAPMPETAPLSKPVASPAPSRKVNEPPAASSYESQLASVPSRRSRDASKTTTQKLSTTMPNSNVNSLSRSSRSRKEVTQSSLPPVAAEQGNFTGHEEESGFVPQGASRMQKLSRSAVKNKKSSGGKSKFPLNRIALIVGSGLAVCVPLAVGVALITGDDEQDAAQSGSTKTVQLGAEEKKNTSNTAADEKTADESTPETKGKLILAEQGNKVYHYHLSGTDQVEVEIKATQSEGSWVQLRNQLDSDQYIDDFVQKTDYKTYTKTITLSKDSPELWVQFGRPQNVIVTVNGQSVNISNYLHIRKID